MKLPLDEKGQTVVEYALILVLIAIVVVAIYFLVEDAVRDLATQLLGGL